MTPAGVQESVGDAPPETLPRYVTMPLLDRISQQSLEQDYEHVAARRASAVEGRDREGRTPRVGTAVGVALFGALLAVAGLQTVRQADTAATSHAALVEQVQTRDAEVDEQQQTIVDLRADNAVLQDELDAVTEDLDAVQNRALRARIRTGFTPVRGEGVRVTVDDGPGTVDDPDAGRVRDVDLATLVDGLWNAGAEAIAINGQRLTVLAPIRTSGTAIHVNNQPVSPPYTVSAIGDNSALISRFADSTSGLTWLQLTQAFGFTSDMENVDELHLPGARLPTLMYAEGPAGPTNREEVAP